MPNKKNTNSSKQDSRIQTLNLYDNEELIAKVASALSVKTRRDIIKLINISPHSINDIAWKLSIPVSTASFHVKNLVEAGILMYSYNTQRRGNEKIVTLGNYIITLFLGTLLENNPKFNKVKNIEIPIGSYSSCEVVAPCGIILNNDEILLADSPIAFYHPNRHLAKALWLKQGFLEYTIPLFNYSKTSTHNIEAIDKGSIIALGFSFEICSETAQYCHNYKSDITLSVNDIEICTFLSNGDYGERKGKLNEHTFPDAQTQYGLLQNLDVRFDGTYLNEKRVSDVCIDDLNLKECELIKFKIEVKKDAVHVGGFNLFGKNHGDYAQDIIMSITYKNSSLVINYNKKK